MSAQPRATPDRAQVLDYAARHGDQAAAERFQVRRATVRQWRHRATKRAAGTAGQQPVTAVTPAAATFHGPPGGEGAQPVTGVTGVTVAVAAVHGAPKKAATPSAPSCGRCGGEGRIVVALRSSLLGRELLARLPGGNLPAPTEGVMPCPDCGGPGRVALTTWPSATWAAGMAALSNWEDGSQEGARYFRWREGEYRKDVRAAGCADCRRRGPRGRCYQHRQRRYR